jgi:hypothetical protein
LARENRLKIVGQCLGVFYRKEKAFWHHVEVQAIVNSEAWKGVPNH